MLHVFIFLFSGERCMLRGRCFLIAVVLLLGLAAPSRAGEATLFTLWPLIDYRADEALGYRSLRLLGPLIKYETKDDETEFAVRPLFHRAADDADLAQTEVLYPFAVKRSGPETEFVNILQLLNYDFGATERGSANKFYLFPFLFYGDHAEHGRYAAFFPIGGTLHGWFGRDRITFTLFPLYSRTERGTTTTTHVLWPIFSRVSGEEESGFAVWPLYGQSSKTGVYRRQFCLWPIYFNEEIGLDSNNPVMRRAVLPLWFEQESRTYSQRTVLWPFFNWIQDRAGEYEQWDAPWPLVRVTHGADRHGLRLLPFYADESVGARRKRWFLWPIYKIEDTETELIVRQRHRVLFFLYSDLVERKLDSGQEQRRVDLWPLFSYHREGGVSRLNALALLEPLFPGNQAIERSWSPLWRVYQQRWDEHGNLVVSLLWNLYWQERQGEKLAFELFPLVDYHRDTTATRLRLFKGLITLRSEARSRCLKLFYLPWGTCWDANPSSPATAAVPVTAE
jgi:hypothetical protein